MMDKMKNKNTTLSEQFQKKNPQNRRMEKLGDDIQLQQEK